MRINVVTDRKEFAKKSAAATKENLKIEVYEKLHRDFIRKTNLKGVYTRINAQIDLALQSNENSLELKRNQLKAKLLEDETCLTYEFVKKAQEYAEMLGQKKKLKAAAILEAYEKDRLDFVEEMYAKQKLMNCEELRSRMSGERRRMLMKVHELQIIEKERLKEKEKQNDLMYGEIMNSTDRYDFDTVLRRNQIQGRLENEEFLKKQIRARELGKAEVELIKAREIAVRKQFEETMREEERFDLERKRKNKQEMNQFFLDQLKLDKLLKSQRDNYESEMDKMFIENLKKDTLENKAGEIVEKKNLAKELHEFAQEWQRVNEMKRQQELEDDKVIARANQEKLEEMRVYKAEKRAAKKQLAKETVSTWGEQIRWKQEREQEAKDLAKAELDLYNTCNIDIDNSRRRQRREDALQLQEAQKQQMLYGQLLNKRAVDEERRRDKEMIENSEAQLKECLNVRQESGLIQHPFYTVLFRTNR